MFLFINTAVPNEMILALSDRKGNLIFSKKNITQCRQSEKLLVNIDKLLGSRQVMLKKIKGIIVVSGPGAFTSLRVGVVTANTLGFALGIPVVGLRSTKTIEPELLVRLGLRKSRGVKAGEIIEPFYGKEPNITYPTPHPFRKRVRG